MVRIYRENEYLIIVAEGMGPLPISYYEMEENLGRIEIRNIETGDPLYNGDWRGIRNKTGNDFENAALLLNYLNSVFTPISSTEQRLLDLESSGIVYIESASSLPFSVQDKTKKLIVNLVGMTSDIEVSSYSPTGLIPGALVRIRKLDDTQYKITYNKDSLQYEFVDKRTEYIDLFWNGNELII